MFSLKILSRQEPYLENWVFTEVRIHYEDLLSTGESRIQIVDKW